MTDPVLVAAVSACACVVMMVSSAGVAAESGQAFRDSFDGRAPSGTWRGIGGEWRAAQGSFRQSSSTGGYCASVATLAFAPDFFSIEATPEEKNAHRFCSIGLVLKYLDADNNAIIRFGSYGGTSIMWREAGRKRIDTLGTFSCEKGRTYHLAMARFGDRMAVILDGSLQCVLGDPWPGKPGRVGLFTESECRFDGFAAFGGTVARKELRTHLAGLCGTRRAADTPAEVPASGRHVSGTPRLELEFASFRPAPAPQGVESPGGGGAYLYVRNRGPGPAQLGRVKIGASDASRFGWYRQRPWSLAAGEVGEIVLRMWELPWEVWLSLLEKPDAGAALALTVEPVGGPPLDVRVPVRAELDPVQINYVGFDESLARVFVYVQRNPSGVGRIWRLSALQVNGHDMTGSARFGSRSVGDHVVPIVVEMPRPLGQGEPVVVCVRTREGARAGHALRAFPGKFHIQVTLLGPQTRTDAVEDIYRHGATCIGLCGAGEEALCQAKALGLEAFHYDSRGLRALRRFDRPEFPPIAGVWLDERDKRPPMETVSLVRECEAAYRQEGRLIPLQMINLVGSRTPRAIEYYELVDAACAGFGFHGGELGKEFGRLSSLPHREYRISRRTFLPYFRNAEMPIEVDPARKRVVGRVPSFRRCVEPKEERWMTYGSLIQGAKGIMHWNYSAALLGPRNWFSRDEDRRVIRAALGGALDHNPHGYEIPADAAWDLKRVWDEIGRINVELRAIGPLVAVSDVSDLAKIISPASGKAGAGEPPAEAAALLSGLDSIVLIVLNHRIRTNWKADADRGIVSYDPIDVDVELRLPEWLRPTCVFGVGYDGVRPVRPERRGDRMRFAFRALEVSQVVVITERAELMGSMADSVRTLKARLNGTD